MRDVIYGCWCKGRRIGGLKLPPIGLLIIASVLKKDGFDTTFMDAGLAGADYQSIISSAGEFDAVVTSTSTHTILEDQDCLLEMKARNPNLFSIVFGPRPTFLPELVLKSGAYDMCIQREGDFVIRDVLRCHRDGGTEDWKNVKGISFLNEDQETVVNEEYPLIKDLDDIAYPDRSMLPRNVDYFNPVALRFPLTTMMISRGCPAKCTFCLSPYFYGSRVRYRSTENVMEELREIVRLGYKEVFFRDETFTVNKRRVTEVCEAMVAEGIDITWTANARVGMLDRELTRTMKRAGCHTIKFGIESGSQTIVDRIQKGINLEEAVETFKWLKEEGINTHAHFIAGHPGETREELDETIAFIKRLPASTISMGILTPYPGTPQFDDLVDDHPEVLDPAHADFARPDNGYLASLGCEMEPEEIEKGVERGYKAFYLRPSYLAGWIPKIKSFDHFKRLTISGATIFQFMYKADA